MTQASRQRHAVLLLAAIRAEAIAGRMDADHFREYVQDLTDGLDLPDPTEVPRHAA